MKYIIYKPKTKFFWKFFNDNKLTVVSWISDA